MKIGIELLLLRQAGFQRLNLRILLAHQFVQLLNRSNGVHNMTYAVQILMDSLKALDKNFDDSKRP